MLNVRWQFEMKYKFMKIVLALLLSCCFLFTVGQKKKTYFPAWTFHQSNSNIYGLSVGLWNFSSSLRNTTSNGIRISLIGEGILAPLAPSAPSYLEDSIIQDFDEKKFNEKINGISLSGTGNAGDYIINGIAIGTVGQLNSKVNGISAAMMVNYAGIHNGIQLAMINDANQMKGFQIGFINRTKHSKGIQIGFWNINEHRKFPIINWSFK